MFEQDWVHGASYIVPTTQTIVKIAKVKVAVTLTFDP